MFVYSYEGFQSKVLVRMELESKIMYSKRKVVEAQARGVECELGRSKCQTQNPVLLPLCPNSHGDTNFLSKRQIISLTLISSCTNYLHTLIANFSTAI